jgi:hypothetical protein
MEMYFHPPSLPLRFISSSLKHDCDPPRSGNGDLSSATFWG